MLKSDVSQTNNIIKLPGLVDVHVHLREPGATRKEDFYTGTQAAVAGGYTQILDMPNNNPPTDTPAALTTKQKLSEGKSWCDLGFNFGATAKSTKYFKKIQNDVFGAKVYMSHTTGPLLVDKNKDLSKIYESWNSLVPLMIHAQGELVETAIRLAKKYHKAIHICHMTGDQVQPVMKAKGDGVQITSEVTPHHLFLTKSDEKKLGSFGIMKPPLEAKRNQQKLWDNIDKIDMISTDHAPHTLEEKKASPAPFGVPGLETTLPLLFNAIAENRFSTERLITMMATNPREIFHLNLQPDTFVLLDFSQTFKISKNRLFTKSKWTPFDGMPGRGEVKKVVIRGKAVYSEGQFIGKPLGKIIKPN